MSAFRLISAVKKQIIRARLLIQCRAREREREKYTREITRLIDKSFSFFGAEKWKLKGEQRCGEPIAARLAVIGWHRDPAYLGLIWEFTGARRISLRRISLMNPNTAWIKSFTRLCCIFVTGWSNLQQVSGRVACVTSVFFFLIQRARRRKRSIYRSAVYLLLPRLEI